MIELRSRSGINVFKNLSTGISGRFIFVKMILIMFETNYDCFGGDGADDETKCGRENLEALHCTINAIRRNPRRISKGHSNDS